MRILPTLAAAMVVAMSAHAALGGEVANGTDLNGQSANGRFVQGTALNGFRWNGLSPNGRFVQGRILNGTRLAPATKAAPFDGNAVTITKVRLPLRR